jgi:hypothetical protein
MEVQTPLGRWQKPFLPHLVMFRLSLGGFYWVITPCMAVYTLLTQVYTSCVAVYTSFYLAGQVYTFRLAVKTGFYLTTQLYTNLYLSRGAPYLSPSGTNC